MTTEIHVNSNIGPPTGENDSEKSQEDSNHDSRDSGKDGEGVSDSYVHLVPEMNNTATHLPIPFHMSQSQKKRRKFIPFKYHSKIFKKSKKTDKNGNHLSPVERAVPRNQTTHHAIEDHRSSTASSSYASCRPHGRDVSCHTYVDIEDVIDHRDNRDMELERCNSISTVSTLPMITLQPPAEDVVILQNGGRRNLDDIQEDPQTVMTPRIHYEMKAPSKTKRIKKYMILFSVLLFIVVLSIVIAFYVGTKNVVDDIPQQVGEKFKGLPAVQNLKTSLDNLTHGQGNLDKGLLNINADSKGIIKQHMENMTKTIDKKFERLEIETEKNELLLHRLLSETGTGFERLKDETEKENELLLHRLLNETVSDILLWKDDIVKKLYTVIHSTVCIRNCTGRDDGDYQSCFTCDGFIKCTGSIMHNETCALSYPDRPVHWDNIQGKCLYSSSTCDPAYLNETFKKI
uniref:Uncharacterized protein LOC111104602 isoform X2 n=1 Tax=Crassostrea virginica TaxID=6565 RepID=A0A8B8AVQ0_CRAVI|nr:uncharacterized protein LOC111104602 isoform X2 [Crassostrea virginica]